MRKYKVVDLFGNETLKVLDRPAINKKNLFTEYDRFVELIYYKQFKN